ncbi:TPA: thioester-forming surface-anchored protein, partial [Streptococcus equi subsp. zooepidemicus]|nr:thioester-forming surface-anchored protein [Streptococcus equi subsp. zooepidemicus]
MKKMLAASTVCIIMSGSFIGGSARILAEQYYGWNDTTRHDSPFFLYVTPTNESQRKTENSNVVYCFNRLSSYPAPWEARFQSMDPKKLGIPLPTYEKKLGNNPLLKEYSQKHSDNLASKLLNILVNGYPYKTLDRLNGEQSRRVTQLAIWHFTDGYSKTHFKNNYNLSDEEDQELQKLIDGAEKSTVTSATYSLDLYITSSYTPEHKPYQHLLGSTLIPKKPESAPKPPGGENPHRLPGGEGHTEYPKGESGEAGPPEKPKPNPGPKPPGGKNPKPLPGEEGNTEYPKGESGEAGPPEKPKLDPEPNPDPMPQPEPQPMPDPAPKPMDPKPESKPEPKPTPQPEVKPKPETKPQKPTKPSNATSQSSGKALPKTNDTGSLMTALGTGLLSLLGLGFLTKRKRKD